MSLNLSDVYNHITKGCDYIYTVIYGVSTSYRKDDTIHDPHCKSGLFEDSTDSSSQQRQ